MSSSRVTLVSPLVHTHLSFNELEIPKFNNLCARLLRCPQPMLHQPVSFLQDVPYLYSLPVSRRLTSSTRPLIVQQRSTYSPSHRTLPYHSQHFYPARSTSPHWKLQTRSTSCTPDQYPLSSDFIPPNSFLPSRHNPQEYPLFCPQPFLWIRNSELTKEVHTPRVNSKSTRNRKEQQVSSLQNLPVL